MMTKNDIFIEKSKGIHGDKYDYSKVRYKGSKTKVCIICPIHGEFYQTPENHLKRCGCPKCTKVCKLTTKEFINKSIKIHANKYDYSKVEYVNTSTKVCVICSEHGEFWQTPHNHLKGKGCIKCAGINKYSTEEFVEKANGAHGYKYDYSKVNYINVKTKVCIICPEHGEFWQMPDNHLQGCGCPKCYGNIKLTTEEFIEKAKAVHGNKYGYSKVNYINAITEVCIICPEHGEFYQAPNVHMSQKRGCTKCTTPSKLEEEVNNALDKLSIEYISQYRPLFLKKGKGQQSLDFYLPNLKIAIECQGKQHYGYGGWSKRFNFNEQVERDNRKYRLCKENNIDVLYYSNIKSNDSINNIDDLIKIINSYF